MTEQSLLISLKEFVRNLHLIEHGETIIVAVSGGVDSMVMLDLLDRLRSELSLQLVVAHFNHQLRGGESDADEEFVRSVARERGLDCYIENANTALMAEDRKLSVQEAARDIRYKFLERLRSSMGYNKIVTAHHADDNAETIIFNLMRGSGIHGLSGIPTLRRDIPVVRPLLFATRDRIEAYATERQLRHREDSSNAQSDYTRNFVRKELVPLIQNNINPNLSGTLRRTSELFDDLEKYVESEAQKLLPVVLLRESPREVVINLNELHKLEIFLQEHLIHQLGQRVVSQEMDFTSVKTVLSLSHAETGSSCSLRHGVTAYRDRDHLVFRQGSRPAPVRQKIEIGKPCTFDSFSFSSGIVPSRESPGNPNVEYVDFEKVGQDLLIRTWNDGDWFIPLGMQDKKKLSDFFIDQKVPLFEKHSIPILLSGSDIVWICGRRLDDRFKITPHTTTILKLEYIPR